MRDRARMLVTVLGGGAAVPVEPSTLAWATGVWANGAWANGSWVGMAASFLLFYPATVEPEMSAWQTFTYALQALWTSFRSIFA